MATNTAHRPRLNHTSRKVTRELPLVAFTMTCSHPGREYGVAERDLVWCNACGDQRRVATILAT